MTDQPLFRIGIDLGGTKTEALLLDPAGAVLFRERCATPLSDGYQAVTASVAELVRHAALQVPEEFGYSIGVGIPGSIDAGTGRVRNANSVCLIGQPSPRTWSGFSAGG